MEVPSTGGLLDELKRFVGEEETAVDGWILACVGLDIRAILQVDAPDGPVEVYLDAEGGQVEANLVVPRCRGRGKDGVVDRLPELPTVICVDVERPGER